MLLEQTTQRVAVGRLVARREHDLGAARERQHQLEDRDVERQRRHRDEPVGLAEARALLHRVRKLTTARCGTSTPFGVPVEPDV